MEQILFISNVNNKSRISELNSVITNVSSFKFEVTNLTKNEIISKYPNNVIFLENIELGFYMKNKSITLTEENIKPLLSEIVKYKADKDERNITIRYNYSLIVHGKVIFTTGHYLDGYLLRKSTGKSDMFFEKYINVMKAYGPLSLVSTEKKENYIKFSHYMKKLMGYYVCYLNDIDTNRLSEYCKNTKITTVDSSTNVNYEYGLLSTGIDNLTIYFDEYFQTRGWGDWLFSGRTNFPISVKIKSEVDNYYDRLESEKKEAEIKKESERKEKDAKEEVERQEALIRNQRSNSSSNSYSNNHCSSDFDEADYDRRGREGHGWSSSIDGYTNDEVAYYRSRVYERETGQPMESGL